MRVDLARPARRDQQRGLRSAHRAGPERAVPAASSPRWTLPEGLALEDDRASLRCGHARGGSERAQRGRSTPHGHADVDQLDRRSVVAVAVAQLVRTREGLAQDVRVDGLGLLDGQLEGLAAIAQLVANAHARWSNVECGAGLGDERVALADSRSAVRESPPSMTVRETSRRGAAAARPSAQSTPEARGQRMRSIPSSRASAAACSGPAPPNGIRTKLAGVDSPLDGHHAQGAQHLRLGHADDPFRAGEHVQVELVRELGDRALGRGAVEHEPARER